MAKRAAISTEKSELDRLQKERVNMFLKSFRSKGLAIEEIFTSEKVVATVKKEKILLPSYNLAKILSFLPFTPTIYVSICPKCPVNDLNIFRPLVERGAIVPIGNYTPVQ